APGSILEAALNEVKQLLAAIAEQQAAFGDAIETASKTLATKDVLNNDLMANCNQLRDRCWKAEGELARWQKIAMDLKAKEIQEANSGDFVDARGEYMFRIADIGKCREQAAKELNLRVTQEAGYVERLQEAFIIADANLLARQRFGEDWHNESCIKSAYEEARADLAKIREGK
ncbi:MAG: hypothetical protein M0Q43_11630, partial [Methanothrix sp.]|nr:hypothetical protein [Methanothrix sp.]